MHNPLEQYDFVDTDYMDTHKEEFEPLIGRIIIDFSYLEYELNKIIAEIVNDRTDEIGYMVTNKMSMSNKIDLLERFMHLEKAHGLKRPKRIISLIPLLRSINSFRNDVAHASWASTRSSGMTRVKVKVDAKVGVWFQNKNMSISNLKKRHSELLKLIEKLENIDLSF